MAMAFGTSAASAQTPVELEHEGGAHCRSSDPCDVAVHGEVHLSLFGFIVSDCEEEMSLEFGEDGSGHVVGGTLSDHSDGGDCTRARCNGVGEQPEEAEWDVINSREVAPNQVIMEVATCLDAADSPNDTGTHCNVPMNVVEAEGTHSYLWSTNFQCPSLVRIEGIWNAEETPIEIEHAT
ncbi:MAG TPA: hypothetical protein VHF90_03790 [Thermoleophilaceae bacterium]|nr:hypothetical protein [Thermoleophilaceae bacterium]